MERVPGMRGWPHLQKPTPVIHCINGVGLETYTIISIGTGMREGMGDDLGMAWDRKGRWDVGQDGGWDEMRWYRRWEYAGDGTGVGTGFDGMACDYIHNPGC